MSETLTIILPLPNGLLSPNHTVGSRGGRFAKMGAIKKYRKQARAAAEAEEVETTPWGRCTVQADFYYRDRRRRDPDNAIASLKPAYDGIVDSGLVADDDYEHMTRLPPTFNVDKTSPRVELTITRCD
jgi:crossover junction endodeoxyribonuclease RusA